MCHEGWIRRRREQEEAREMWDRFTRETARPAEPRESEVRLEEQAAESTEEREPVEVER